MRRCIPCEDMARHECARRSNLGSGYALTAHGLWATPILYTGPIVCANYRTMLGLRTFIRRRRLSTLLAVCVAYSLAIQALIASVGLGMSAYAAPNQDGLVICSHLSAQAQLPGGKDQKPSRVPECPFCFVAAHSTGSFSLADNAPAFPAYAGVFVAVDLDHSGQTGFVAQYRRTTGAPRAPPTVSV
jgi:hypothetical protein